MADSLSLTPRYAGQVLSVGPQSIQLQWGVPVFEHQLSAVPAGEAVWPVAGVGGAVPPFSSSAFGQPLLFEIMSKLTVEGATAQADDVKKRVSVTLGGATAACITFVNAHNTLNCVAMSKDAAIVRCPPRDTPRAHTHALTQSRQTTGGGGLQ